MTIASTLQQLHDDLVAHMAAEGRPDFAVTEIAWGSAGGVCVGLNPDCAGDGTLAVSVDPLAMLTAQRQTRSQSVQWCNSRQQVGTLIEVTRSYPQPDGQVVPELAVGAEVTAAAGVLADDLQTVWLWLVENQAAPSWLDTPGVGIDIGEPEMIEPGGGCAGFIIRIGWHLRTPQT